ncbi:unnamed protein product [Schistosoma bovis]|nr:unnamed protein product [Schistosoma bovis]
MNMQRSYHSIYSIVSSLKDKSDISILLANQFNAPPSVQSTTGMNDIYNVSSLLYILWLSHLMKNSQLSMPPSIKYMSYDQIHSLHILKSSKKVTKCDNYGITFPNDGFQPFFNRTFDPTMIKQQSTQSDLAVQHLNLSE